MGYLGGGEFSVRILLGGMSSSDAMSIDEGPLWQPDRKERKRKRSAER